MKHNYQPHLETLEERNMLSAPPVTDMDGPIDQTRNPDDIRVANGVGEGANSVSRRSSRRDHLPASEISIRPLLSSEMIPFDQPRSTLASAHLVDRVHRLRNRSNPLVIAAARGLTQIEAQLDELRQILLEVVDASSRGEPLTSNELNPRQLRIDITLESINRDAFRFTFQGMRILDGTLELILDEIDSERIECLHVDRFPLSNHTPTLVTVHVLKQATRGELIYHSDIVPDDVRLRIASSRGKRTFISLQDFP